MHNIHKGDVFFWLINTNGKTIEYDKVEVNVHKVVPMSKEKMIIDVLASSIVDTLLLFAMIIQSIHVRVCFVSLRYFPLGSKNKFYM